MIDIDDYLKILFMNIGFIWVIIYGYILFNPNIDLTQKNNPCDVKSEFSSEYYICEHNNQMKNDKYYSDILLRIDKTLAILNSDIHHIRKRLHVMEKKIDHICKCIDYQISVSIDE